MSSSVGIMGSRLETSTVSLLQCELQSGQVPTLARCPGLFGGSPRSYYRVEDEGSQAVTLPGQGIRARGPEMIDFRARYGWSFRVLKRNVMNHMNWQSPYVSSLISTYCDEKAAWAEAERRVARGRRNVNYHGD